MSEPIDPNHLDVVAQPRRRRKRPHVPESLRGELAQAKERAKRRPASAGILVEPEQNGDYRYSSPYVERRDWELILADAFGTRSIAVIKTFINQLTELCRKRFDEKARVWLPDEDQLNLCLNLINSVKPKKELEAALCAQMCASHLMMMQLSAQALSGVIDPVSAAVASKLARTFAMQLDALNRSRGKAKTTKQKITVKYERHNHEHQHVHLARGAGDFGQQPHATEEPATGWTAGRAALPSPDEVGQPVRFPGRAGQTGVSDARGKRLRRA